MKLNYVYLISSDNNIEKVVSQCIEASYGNIRLKDLRIISETTGGWVGLEWTYNEKSLTYSAKLLGHIDDFPEYFI